jgi:predicted GNAT superfamily acetyltransferase
VDTLEQAVAAAAAASRRAGVEIWLAVGQRDADEAVEVLSEVWPGMTLAADVVHALAYAGNYVSIARVGATAVGASVAFRGHDAEGPLLHSHSTGVLPGTEGAASGYALKLHQRAWALAEDLPRIEWTFDPLVARNAFFNVTKLGATVERFHEDFYGQLADGVNAGDESDRFVVIWRLAGERASSAAAGRAEAPDIARLRSAGAQVVLAVGADGEPVVADVDGEVVLAQVPTDIVALRRRDPALATAWRRGARAVFGPALRSGRRVVGVDRDGWYVLG